MAIALVFYFLQPLRAAIRSAQRVENFHFKNNFFHLLAGWDSDGGLEDVVVLSPQVALQRHLGVSVEVGVCDARPGDAGHEAGLCLSRQIGPLLNRDKVDVV